MRKLDEIIVHCAATKPGMRVTEKEIREWHLARGFVDIGYHFVVLVDGEVRQGRPISQIGAHCKGRNATSVGVCYVGGLNAAGKPADTRTEAQKRSLRTLIARLKKEYDIKKVSSHSDYANKACPCFNATAEYTDVG